MSLRNRASSSVFGFAFQPSARFLAAPDSDDSAERAASAEDSAFLGGHYNKGRPHSSLGHGIPETPIARPLPQPQLHRHRVQPSCQVRTMNILYGLHHEYSWENCAA